MKEYEYIVEATNDIFSHMISSVICLENYKRSDNLKGSFRHIFHMFLELREDYQECVKENDPALGTEILDAQLKIKCRVKREEIIKRFITELKFINSKIDYEQKLSEFYEKLENEDVETLEMQLLVYPYLLSQIRGEEEKEGE